MVFLRIESLPAAKFTVKAVLMFGTLAGLGACTSATPSKTGSYTAARYQRTGSNIPQPYSAADASDTMSTSQMEAAGNNQANTASRNGGGAR